MTNSGLRRSQARKICSASFSGRNKPTLAPAPGLRRRGFRAAFLARRASQTGCRSARTWSKTGTVTPVKLRKARGFRRKTSVFMPACTGKPPIVQ